MKNYLLTTLLLVTSFFLLSCRRSASVDNKGNMEIRRDMGPITRRLPNLIGNIISVCWVSVPLSKDSFLSPPSHPAYRLYGSAELSEAAIKQFWEKYKWYSVEPNSRPNLFLNGAKTTQFDWMESNDFTKEMKPNLVVGRLFFSPSKGLLYFDIEVER